MNAIDNALQDIRYAIPSEVLQMAFIDYNNTWRRSPVSLDDRIRNVVIRTRVLKDCNLAGGIEKKIPLDNVPSYHHQDTHIEYDIPKSMTDGRTIMSCLYVTAGVDIGYPMAANQLGGGSSNLSMAGNKLANATGNSEALHSARIEIIGENVVLIKYLYVPFGPLVLAAILSNDENLNNITPKSYPDFSELCVLATKAYIYNNMIIKLDKSALYGGHELGAISTYIESLSDSEEQYRDFLRNVWAKVAVMNDEEQWQPYLKLHFPISL